MFWDCFIRFPCFTLLCSFWTPERPLKTNNKHFQNKGFTASLAKYTEILVQSIAHFATNAAKSTIIIARCLESASEREI
jgi:hypothetical protein